MEQKNFSETYISGIGSFCSVPHCLLIHYFRNYCKPDEILQQAWQTIMENKIIIGDKSLLKHKEKETELEPDLNPDKRKNKLKYFFTIIFLLICVAGASLGIRRQKISTGKPKYWVYPNSENLNSKDGHLRHLHIVLERLGYEKSTNDVPWTLLWSQEYPSRVVNLHNLSRNQMVNVFPGTSCICSKVDLATTTNSKYIPKAFRLPKHKNEFLKYAAENKNAMFVQKGNAHRNVYLRNVSDIDLANKTSFIQEYIQKPFLVDGHKFDIGVYVVLKSVNPLRVYWYKGDVGFRYCPAKYYPLDPKTMDKYVVRDNYLPTWKVPALAHSFTALGNSMKEAFDIYVRSMGKDPSAMWEDVNKAIAEAFIKKEHIIINVLKKFPSKENFFQLMRFDLIVDENFKVYLLEANMGPNLSAKRYPQNRLLFEQVLYNLFSLTGVARGTFMNTNEGDDAKEIANMISAEKNIAVFGDECRTTCKDNCNALIVCDLCKPCLSAAMKKTLLNAHSEFLHRGDFRRLIPASMVPKKDIQLLLEELKNVSPNNTLLHLWYQGKCNQDITWCT